MQDTKDSNDTSATLRRMIERMEALERKVARLQERLDHDHEDLERLQDIAMHDHEDLETLKVSGRTRPAYGSRPMVGL